MGVVLVADDEPAIRDLVCTIVASAGHKCIATANGLEAVAVFRSTRDAIDLVITDMLMPVMDGAEAIARIRETKPAVPVICMSGYSDQPIPSGALFVHKPFTVSTLLGLIRQVLTG